MMEETETRAGTWRTSSYSGANGGQCIEVGSAAPVVVVRDTKDRASAVLRFTPEDWRAFVTKIKNNLGNPGRRSQVHSVDGHNLVVHSAYGLGCGY